MNTLKLEDIKKQAKKIMDSFSKELDKVKISEEARVEREKDRREEKEEAVEKEKENSDFRKIMFENAPDKDDNCIKAEKGGWIE